MKKIIYISLLALAGLFASCTQEHIEVVYNPDNAVAQTLGTFQGAALAADGEAISADFTPVDFGIAVGVNYELHVSADQAFTTSNKITATFSENTVSVAQKNINSTILNMGGVPDEEFTIYFKLKAFIKTDKGQNANVDGIESNVVSATYIPYNMTIKDVDVYNHVWVIGAAAKVSGWSHDKVYQFLYDYDKTGSTYTGTIDFGDEGPSGGFKLTGIAGWDDSCNWGSPDQGESAEASSIQLITGGSSKDIKCFSKRYYVFSFNTSTLVLNVVNSFNNVGIVGAFNGWAPDDASCKMTYNDYYHRFYIDYTFAEDTEFKCTCDDAWDQNWGKDCVSGGDNIQISAGSYRIYLDLNTKSLSADANMFGKDEPGAEPSDEPEKPQVWSLIGTLNGTSWDTDYDLANTEGDTWVIRGVTVTESDEFKIRADHDWSVNVGGTEANSKSTIDPSNPYDVFKPEIGVAFAAGGQNIQIGKAGVYDITFNYSAEGSTILIEEHVAAYSLIGEINGDSWKKDIVMKQEGDVWTSPVVNITGGFKIRYDYSWADDNTYGVEDGFTPVIGTAFKAVQPGANITVPEAGDYKVSFNASTKEITIESVEFPEHLYMIGAEFGAWDWSSDGVVEMTPVCYQFNADNLGIGEFWTVRYFTAGQGFKFCSQRAWNGDFWGLDINDGFVEEGGNCTVTVDGYYMVHVDLKRGMVHVEPARIYGMGDCFGGWNEGMEPALFKADGKTLKAELQESGEIRMYAASSIADTDWWTREFIFLDGKIVYRGNAGDQERVKGQKGQTVVLDFNAGIASLEGQGEEPSVPETMYVIGNDFGGWDWASDGIVEMIPVNGKSGAFWAIRYITTTTEFKFCSQKAWSGDFCTLETNTGFVTLDNNMVEADGLYIICVDYTAGKVAVEPANVYGIGDCFENGWDAGVKWTVNNDGTVTSPALKAGNVRMYTSAECFGVDWWRMEFNVYDGIIVYRGAGNDQAAVPCEAGNTVTLNFNTGTGVIK